MIVDSRTTGLKKRCKFNQSCRNLNWKLKHHNAFLRSQTMTTQLNGNISNYSCLRKQIPWHKQTSKQTTDFLTIVYSVLTMP